MTEFVHPLRVRYHECDAQGIVFNANYFAFFDVVLTELWREAFGSYEALTATGVDVVVAEATARFRRPGRFDDVLDLGWRVASLGRTSMQAALAVRRDGDLLVEGEMRYVFVDATSFAKTEIPDDVRAVLQRYE